MRRLWRESLISPTSSRWWWRRWWWWWWWWWSLVEGLEKKIGHLWLVLETFKATGCVQVVPKICHGITVLSCACVCTMWYLCLYLYLHVKPFVIVFVFCLVLVFVLVVLLVFYWCFTGVCTSLCACMCTIICCLSICICICTYMSSSSLSLHIRARGWQRWMFQIIDSLDSSLITCKYLIAFEILKDEVNVSQLKQSNHCTALQVKYQINTNSNF